MTNFAAYEHTSTLFHQDDTATREHDTMCGVMEYLVDRFGIGTVLAALGDVVSEKIAGHGELSIDGVAVAEATVGAFISRGITHYFGEQKRRADAGNAMSEAEVVADQGLDL